MAMTKLCPACRMTMDQAEHRGIQYDVCPQCAGLWFDLGELGKARATSISSLQELEEGHTLARSLITTRPLVKACPNDLASLSPFQYSSNPPVELDHCPECGGVWVEEAELGHMNESFNRRLDRTPTSDEATQETGIMQAEIEGEVDHTQRAERAWEFLGQHHLWPGL